MSRVWLEDEIFYTTGVANKFGKRLEDFLDGFRWTEIVTNLLDLSWLYGALSFAFRCL